MLDLSSTSLVPQRELLRAVAPPFWLLLAPQSVARAFRDGGATALAQQRRTVVYGVPSRAVPPV